MNAASQAHYHLIGVAGVGMSALAQAVLADGYCVTGSDRYLGQKDRPPVLDQLAASGIQLVAQDGSGIKSTTKGVIRSTAIEDDNPDLQKAIQLGIPIIHRADMLAELVGSNVCIAVAGTAGKTTVTGILGWLCESLGLDPTVVNGGCCLNWQTAGIPGNFRKGSSDLWIIEVDESDRSFLTFHPDWAVITNISRDHYELNELYTMFSKFFSQVSKGIVAPDSILSLPQIQCQKDDQKRMDSTLTLDMSIPDGFVYHGVNFHVPLLGLHNLQNALSAVVMCELLGLNLNDVADALVAFKGMHRRLEVVDNNTPIKIIDDYAHNPAKITASWNSVREKSQRILGVWRPHGFGPLAVMKDELVGTFKQCMGSQDFLYVLPVYYVGGTTERKVTAEHFVEALKRNGVQAAYVDSYDVLHEALQKGVKSGDVILCMGARDPHLSVFCRDILKTFRG